MDDFEKTMSINETKGLLVGLRNMVEDATFRLKLDNANQLPDKLNTMRMTIDRIEAKITENNTTEEV